MSRKYVSLFLIVVAALMAALILPASAQDTTPVIEVSDQVVLDGTVTIAHIYSEGPGFVVIHADGGGGPGADIGHRSINAGDTSGLQVPIDAAAATPTLFAMLHTDTGEVGVYEFGTVEGADGPVVVGDQPVTPPFGVNVLNAQDQFAPNNTITIASVTAPQASWVVVHSEADGAPGPVLGQTLVQPGTTADVVVNLSGAATGTVFPMLHVDDGVVGEYEFGAVEGVDSPITVGGQVAVLPVWTVPHVRVDDQIVMGGDGMAAMTEPALVARSALSQGPGWLVVHADGGGGPGPVLGFAVADGWNVMSCPNPGRLPTLFPHVARRTGAAGQQSSRP
jgi:hypothetical protein